MVKRPPKPAKARSHRGPVGSRSNFHEKLVSAELARELAHQLNNPLAALTNLAYLARQNSRDQELQAMLDEMESQIGRISTVVQSILTLEQSSPEKRLRTFQKLVDAQAFRRLKEQYESALHLASIVESAVDAIYTKDLEGTILAWNTGAELLFGYSAAEVLGKSALMLIPPDRANEETRILQEIKAGKRVLPFETIRTTRDGSPVRVSVSVSPIRNATGRVVGASTIAREISEGAS